MERNHHYTCQPLPSWLLVTNSTHLPARVNSLVGAGKTVSLEGSWASLVAQTIKNPPAMRETWVRSLVWEDPLEEGMQPTSVFLPRESPWTEEPGRLQSMGLQRVGPDWATKNSTAQHREKLEDQNAQRRIKDLGKYEGSEQMEIWNKEDNQTKMLLTPASHKATFYLK